MCNLDKPGILSIAATIPASLTIATPIIGKLPEIFLAALIAAMLDLESCLPLCSRRTAQDATPLRNAQIILHCPCRRLFHLKLVLS